MKDRRFRIVTNEDIDEICFMWKTGKYYITEIAEWIGITPQAVMYWLKKRGLC